MAGSDPHRGRIASLQCQNGLRLGSFSCGTAKFDEALPSTAWGLSEKGEYAARDILGVK
jgi:hypothetical protein